jgi:hypothetical protein
LTLNIEDLGCEYVKELGNMVAIVKLPEEFKSSTM